MLSRFEASGQQENGIRRGAEMCGQRPVKAGTHAILCPQDVAELPLSSPVHRLK